MAISNYTELQAAIENWLDRSDLSARVPEFIALAEAQMNRALRIRIMEGRYTASTVKAQRIYALPTDYRQMRSLRINLDPIVALVYLTPQNMNQVWAGSSTGTPMPSSWASSRAVSTTSAPGSPRELSRATSTSR